MIPKIIHFIWLGPRLMPLDIDLWRSLNPTFEIKLWNQPMIDELGFDKSLYNKMYFDGQSDIARYYILHKYGGLYFDTDCVPLRPLDDSLLQEWASYESETARYGLVANGMMGMEKNSKLMKETIDNLPLDPGEAWRTTGPLYLTNLINKLKYPIKIYPSNMFYGKHYTGCGGSCKEAYTIHTSYSKGDR
jgi:mannosyltransferase OCH1-like enzyme